MGQQCKDAGTSLIDWIEHARSSAEDPDLRVAMIWPLELNERFTCLLRQREEAVVKGLLIFCKAMELAGVRNWYLKDGEDLLLFH